ncbi:hypothetical protein [Flavobacterium sp. DSP2-3-1]|jgi:hypothetical protein|uniref:hypothetical protein n=1 Tax=Flavobacterium sp. DSP2-3-1 TaxID=2804620 RepID=UPI003CE6D4C3
MKNLLLSAIAAITMTACDNEAQFNPQLPAITQVGANTFGAIIKGQIMVPRNSQGYIPPGSSHNPVLYTGFDNWEEISASDRKTIMGGIYIYIENIDKKYPLKVDNYIIGNSDGALSNSFAENTLITANVYDNTGKAKIYLSIADSGSINITRSDNDIISGIFSCKLRDKENPDDIIEIKEGRFDFTKSTINSTNFN